MSWRTIMGTAAASDGDTQITHNPRINVITKVFEDIEQVEDGLSLRPVSEKSQVAGPPPAPPSIDGLLITLTLAVHYYRTHPRPAWVTGRRTTIEDGLAVAKCMDALDFLAKAAASRPELLRYASGLVDTAAGLIREWKFAQSYQLLDEIKRLAKGQSE